MSNQTLNYFQKYIELSHKLTKKEKLIVSGRLKMKKLKQLGKALHLSDERIRQIEEKSLRKLQCKIVQEALF